MPAPFASPRHAVAAALSLSAAAALPAHADIIFNSFGPNNAVSAGGGGFAISGGQQTAIAVRFVPTATVRVTQVSAYLRSVGGNGSSSLFSAIVPESASLPGASPVWTSSPTVVSPAGQIAVFTSPTSATLNAGQPYWLLIDGTVSQGNAAVAHAGLPPVFGSYAFRNGPGVPWVRTDGAELPAVRIDGALIGACCNPDTGGCLVLDTSTCSTLGLRFDGLNSACSPATCRACPGDFNHSGAKSTQDLFDFLAAYFSPCP
ncbi:MAG: hypothetical protein IT438_10455 [Phycisphaerales bacterium]|nr:hypothetical protein [Phycisphaerales bacterium]